MRRKWLLFVVFWLGSVVFGCADADDESGALQCVQKALRGDLQEETVFFSTSCDDLAGDLIGVWDSVNLGDPIRYVIEAGGHYSFWVQNRNRWSKQYDGVFWIEYHPSMGLLRTEMHMSIPDNDDYGVRYHIAGDILHFEDPSNGLRTIQFRKVE